MTISPTIYLSITRLVFATMLLMHMPQAWAHGFVETVVVDGKAYPGWNPFSDA